MRWQNLQDERCPVARATSVLGDRWTLLIVRDALLGVSRFEDFQARLGIARRVLSERLQMLVERGVLRKLRYSERPPRDEYRLTAAGRELLPVILTLSRWADRHMPHQGGTLLAYRHLGCGEIVEPGVACPACGEALDTGNVRAEPAMPDKEAERLLAHARPAQRRSDA